MAANSAIPLQFAYPASLVFILTLGNATNAQYHSQIAYIALICHPACNAKQVPTYREEIATTARHRFPAALSVNLQQNACSAKEDTI